MPNNYLQKNNLTEIIVYNYLIHNSDVIKSHANHTNAVKKFDQLYLVSLGWSIDTCASNYIFIAANTFVIYYYYNFSVQILRYVSYVTLGKWWLNSPQEEYTKQQFLLPPRCTGESERSLIIVCKSACSEREKNSR